LSRLDAGTEPLILTTIDPQAWILSIIEAFVERATTQQQNLEVHIPSNLPALTTDLSDLERILTELLNNACKYTPPEGTITVSAQATTRTLQLKVSNSGVEIPERELTHIFDKFYRIPNHDPWKHGGTGLGLALVKKLVEHLKGTIQVESSNGQTTFLVQFPLMSLRV
jgi:signal transduction histidine kinase